tara:strand:- start:2949 stop:3197 length:249 start_codon:yes stop_codon:yes gene_type:complete
MNKKFTTDELTKLKETRERYLVTQDKLGGIEIQKAMLQNSKALVLEELSILQKDEVELGETLRLKYGEGTIDMDKGEFIPKS